MDDGGVTIQERGLGRERERVRIFREEKVKGDGKRERTD